MKPNTIGTLIIESGSEKRIITPPIFILFTPMIAPIITIPPANNTNTRKKRLYLQFDLHWTTEGHDIAAKEVSKAIEKVPILHSIFLGD